MESLGSKGLKQVKLTEVKGRSAGLKERWVARGSRKKGNGLH